MEEGACTAQIDASAAEQNNRGEQADEVRFVRWRQCLYAGGPTGWSEDGTVAVTGTDVCEALVKIDDADREIRDGLLASLATLTGDTTAKLHFGRMIAGACGQGRGPFQESLPHTGLMCGSCGIPRDRATGSHRQAGGGRPPASWRPGCSAVGGAWAAHPPGRADEHGH